jgi:hypothetical protein
VNNKQPRTLINPGREAVVDANFVTFWPEEEASVDAEALLAMLNSTWCITVLELIGTVLGGGALKVEAAHMRRLPIPVLPPGTWSDLSRLGCDLASGDPSTVNAVLEDIDLLIFASLNPSNPDQTRTRVAQVASRRRKARSG